MSMNKGLYSSATDRWATPNHVFAALDAEFHFTLDVCADETNAKCERFYSIENDGLRQLWSGVCWCNPPYGRQIGRWTERALAAAEAGATVVMLLPARTDTRWWHEHVMQANEIRFLRGRLKFGDAKGSAPFPSAIVIFRARLEVCNA